MAKKQKRHVRRETEKRVPEKHPSAVPTTIASMADFWPKAETGKRRVQPMRLDQLPSAASVTRPSTEPTPGGTPASPITARTAGKKSERDRWVAKPDSLAARVPVRDKGKSTVTRAAVPGPASDTRREKYRKLIEAFLVGKPEKPLDINLGIDLGTSFSKVVWRYRENAYPVCFGEHDERLEDYFVPSIVTFDGATLTTESDHGKEESTATGYRIANFKMCLACVSSPVGDCRPESCTFSNWELILASLLMKDEVVRLVNAMFIGQLIARSKTLILKQLKKREGISAPVARWSANLAVPEKYMDHSDILSGFEGVLRTAWLMAIVIESEGAPLRLEEIIDCYECAKQVASDGRELDCFVYPEVGAEVASVTMSRSAKQGLYAFVDIGAGTVDASVFRFHRDRRDGEKQFTYAAEVLKAGAAHVEIEASKKLATQSQGWFRRIKEGNVPIELASETCEETLRPFLAEALDELCGDVKKDLIKLFVEAFAKEKMVERWKDIQLVVGGGGAALPPYDTAALHAFSLKGKGRLVGGNITRVALSVPTDFHMGGLSPKAFDRFAVAYGLSFHHVNLPSLVLASEVKALPPMPTKGRIDPDDR